MFVLTQVWNRKLDVTVLMIHTDPSAAYMTSYWRSKATIGLSYTVSETKGDICKTIPTPYRPDVGMWNL